jgi:hypothetical protein
MMIRRVLSSRCNRRWLCVNLRPVSLGSSVGKSSVRICRSDPVRSYWIAIRVIGNRGVRIIDRLTILVIAIPEYLVFLRCHWLGWFYARVTQLHPGFTRFVKNNFQANGSDRCNPEVTPGTGASDAPGKQIAILLALQPPILYGCRRRSRVVDS